MTKNPKDTEAREAPADGARTSVLEDSAPPDHDDEAVEADLTEDSESLDDEALDKAEEPETAEPAPAGKGYLAETLTAAGLLTIFGALSGLRLLELVPSLFAQSQEGIIAGILLGEGAIALLGVLFALAGIMTAKATTSSWVRWAAPAVIIVGLVLAVVSTGAYLQVPEPQPQPPMMPGG